MVPEKHSPLAIKLRVLRAQQSFTLREAAKRSGLDSNTISRSERGLDMPHDMTLAKLARLYEVPLIEVLEAKIETQKRNSDR